MLFCALWGLLVGAAGATGCHKEVASSPEFVLSPRSHLLVDAQSLPAHFDWRNVSGWNFVTPVRNQQLPHLCGSCWAFASLGALSDRLYIAGGGRATAIALAPQALLDLTWLPPQAGSCNGGNAFLAYEFVRRHGISDETCAPYQGVDSGTWGEDLSTNARMCRTCTWDGTCRFTEGGPRYTVVEHGKVLGVNAMMAEIYKRGPIACAIHAHGTVFNSYTGIPKVIAVDSVFNHTTHLVVIHGWGETSDGVKYWIGKNSYGTSWGLDGFFLLRRGHNDLALESHSCAWAVPVLKGGTSKVSSEDLAKVMTPQEHGAPWVFFA